VSNIIALIDASVYSPSVCDHAAWLAQRTGAGVEVIHALGRWEVSSVPVNLSGNLDANARDILLAELANLDEQKAKLAHKRGRLMLDEAKARLQDDGVADVTTRLRNGDIVETVHDFEDAASFIVIGKRGEAADFASMHLGSNLERVVRATHKPVLVAARAFKPIERFLVAYDGGASAMKAIEHIAESPAFRGMTCRILSVGRETGGVSQQLEEAATHLRDKAGLAVETSVIAGQPDAVIAAEVKSDGIDLVVMGAYGHSRIRSLIIGSTTTEMIRSCLVPIMLFR
jgi:nucleotide-binding universal stress UspA family protein